MNQPESFPEPRDAGQVMSPYYRDLFEKYVAKGSVTEIERQALRWYLSAPQGGRLAALNAIKPLRTEHLDAIMR
jgi:hypothetical protein